MVSKVRESFLSRTDKSAFELLPDIVLQWMKIVVGLWCNWNYLCSGRGGLLRDRVEGWEVGIEV